MHRPLTIGSGQATCLLAKLRAVQEATAAAQETLALIVEGHGITDCVFVSMDDLTLIVNVPDAA